MGRDAEVRATLPRLSVITDAIPLLVAYVDHQLNYRFVNAAYAAWVGVPREDIVGRSAAEVLGPQAFGLLRPHLEAALAGARVSFDAELPDRAPARMRSQAQTRFVRATYAPHLTGRGVRGCVAFIEDITRQRQTTDAVRFLADASKVLSSSLDSLTTLRTLARVAVPRLADWCSVELVRNDGSLEQVAVVHSDERKVKLAEEYRRLYPPDSADPSGVGAVARTGQAELYETIPDVMLDASALDADHLRRMRELGLHSVIIVPLMARNRVLGVLNLVSSESGRSFDREDLAFAQEVAARAGLAMDNARLYENTQALAVRTALLSELFRAIAFAGLEIDKVGHAIAQKITSVIGDCCVLSLVGEDGALRAIAADHRDPAAAATLRAAQTSGVPLDASVAGQAATSGHSVRLTGSALTTALTNVPSAYRAFVASHAPQSVLAVPLLGARRTVGVLSLARGAGGKAYSDDDQGLVEEIGRRLVLALDNARLYSEAQKAVRVRDEFLSVASHELRTPLTTMQLLVSASLMPGNEDKPPLERLKRLDVHLERMSALIDGLLDVSKITGGRLVLTPEPFDLGALAADVVARFDEQSSRVRSTLRLERRGDLSGTWDRERLDQVLTNLLSNALKYGAGRPVTVTVEESEAGVRVSVADEGMGIAPEDQVRIFQQFERASSVRNFAGLGLGLWIIARIVHTHGGRVTVASDLGSGARFMVELPRKVPELAETTG